MTARVLAYADDPGAANYLAPLVPGLRAVGLDVRMLVAPQLAEYVMARSMEAGVRSRQSGPDELLAGIDLLLVGTSEDADCFGLRLTVAARERGIASVGAVDMAVNAANRFRGGSDDPLRFAPDCLVVPDEATRGAYEALGFPARVIAVCGHPHFDAVRTRRRAFELRNREEMRRGAFPDVPAGRPIWLFLAEGVDRLDPTVSFRSPDYSLVGRGDSEFRTVIVLEEILDAAAALAPRPWIVLRLHPKSDLADFAPVLSEVGMISQGCDPLPLLWAADLTVGATTMLLQEAYLLGVPHLSVLPRASERAWLGTLAMGLTAAFFRREDLAKALDAGLDSFRPHSDHLPCDAVQVVAEMVLRLALPKRGYF